MTTKPATNKTPAKRKRITISTTPFELDSEAVIALSKPVERLVIEEASNVYECPYCGAHLATERAFLRHNCIKKDRASIMGTEAGKKAFNLYTEWTIARYGVSNVTEEQFREHSSLFRTFHAIAKHLLEADIAREDLLVRVAAQYEYEPAYWMRVGSKIWDAHKMAIDAEPATTQVYTSMAWLRKKAESENITLETYLSKLSYEQISQLVKSRHLSVHVAFNYMPIVEKIRATPKELREDLLTTLRNDGRYNAVQECKKDPVLLSSIQRTILLNLRSAPSNKQTDEEVPF